VSAIKITFIGAGSLVFTKELVRDILTFPLLEDATIALMDINTERLDHGTGWNPGVHAYILKEYQQTEKTWKDIVKKELDRQLNVNDLKRGHEYAAFIINALKGGVPFKFNGNVPNTKLITNLPDGACVEVPVYVDKADLHPIYVGALPLEIALLTQLSSGIEELAIEGALGGDPVAIYRAIAHDPLTAAVLSLAEIKEMTNELFAQNKDYLPQFKICRV
jgi:alpha-galactosidase